MRGFNELFPFSLDNSIKRKLPEGANLLGIAMDVDHNELDQVEVPAGHVLEWGFIERRGLNGEIGYWYAYSKPESKKNLDLES